MIYVNNIEKDQIEQAVKKVESQTSGEIVPALVGQSDQYSGASWRIAFSVSLVLTYLAYVVWDYYPFYYYLSLQILLLPVGFIIARIPFLFRLAITKRELGEEVYQRALQMFFENGLTDTKDRTGILIFVSRLERQVIILADSGINQKVDKKFWDKIVNNMVLKIKQGKLGPAFVEAIEACGSELKVHFPVKSDDVNELSDNLIQE